MPLLETRALTKRYGDVLALDDLNLTVDAGEVVCLLGANGAGKTTTLNLLLGFLAPTSGQARVAGHVVHDAPQAARAALGYLPEVVQLYPLLSGIETLRFFADLSGQLRPSDEVLHRMLDRVGLQRDAQARRVSGYSKGMRQKLGLAIALSKGGQGVAAGRAAVGPRSESGERADRIGALAGPLPALQQVSMAAAGTDIAHHLDFMA